MHKKNLYSRVFFTVIAAITLHATSFAEPANLGQLKAQVMSYYDSGDYDKEIKKVATEAQQYIDHEAQINAQRSHPKKLALVLDIDETCLSNYTNMKTIDFANLHEKIMEQLQAADEPAIEPVHDLYLAALQQHIDVFFITGRDQRLKDATIKNLHTAGYSTWSGLELRTQPQPTIAYKTAARAKIAAQGYTIIASIGDQESDLIGGFAQKTFKLPNPYYYIP